MNLSRPSLMTLMFGLALAGAADPAVAAQAAVGQDVGINQDRYAGEIDISVNKSQILRVDQPYKDLLVGNPEIADVVPITDRSVYILGKKTGSTSLSIYSANKRLIGIVDISVGANVESLKARLFDLMPREKVEIRAVNGSIVLSGTVSSAASVNTAVSLARRFVDSENVVNLLEVEGSQQVMLAVRFAEVKRTAARALGFNQDVLFNDGNMGLRLLTRGSFGFDTFGILGLDVASGNWTVDSFMDALERNGIVKTLAEPNLIALSGETASFLAGGEFPIPVAQNNTALTTTITVEFKEFGVSLAFTPTVLGDGLISLEVAPEVSAIDPTASLKLATIEIPGLTTRRAKTTVNLYDGQSFAIAGLIQKEFKDQVRGIPGLSNIPILGALFSSTEFQQDETELVIIVTPHLVRPAAPGQLATPADTSTPPSSNDLFLLGKVEGPAPTVPTGGLDGRVGHIMR